MSSPYDPPSRPTSPPETWDPAKRAILAIAQPITRILAIEASSGLLLLAATAVALIWANSGWHDSYHDLWHMPIGFQVGDWGFERSLEFWINDGLMTIFFFVVGMEIRRELFEGELASLKQASLPVAAAIGGMLVPAVIFMAMNVGREGAHGWAIPMATDIAFAVGVLTLLGKHIPNSWRILLLALAVIDDVGAIIVIAAFYSDDIQGMGFLIAGAGLTATLIMRAAAIRMPVLYLIPGLVLWAGLYKGGIHPTLAGVILGLVTPVRPWYGPSGFAETTRTHLKNLDSDPHKLHAQLAEIERARREAVSPVERLIHALHPFVAFVIMPLFALANAGVALGGADLSGDAMWAFLGIAIGLGIGKPLGIAGAAIVTSRMGLTSRSPELTTRGLALIGVVGGIGFTMSLFIANLAFKKNPAMLETAKLGILVGSAAAILVGMVYGAMVVRRRARL
jgi:Na+:H+ antiporter, NhaA family